jgi:hypothetical protein
MATKNASIKLSELAMGSFVIEPVVTKKNWKTAMAEMTLRHTNRLIGLLPKVVCQYL